VRPGVTPSTTPWRLHRGGGFRRRLATALGQEEAAGDVILRRILHGAGAFVLVYYLVPDDFFVVVRKEVVLLLALAAAGVLEVLRLGVGVELPTMRGYETERPASYVFYAVALVVAILFFPEPIACAVVLGTAIVDPLAGGLRSSARHARFGPWLPWGVYTALAATALAAVGGWPWELAVALGAAAGAVGVAAERVKLRWLDDDLTMTVVPALLLYGVGIVALGLPR
jgi:dolichol kinase